MAGEALGDAASASSFLCSADELRFDAPARALAAEEALQPVWLYFASSASTRPPVRWRPRRRCSPGGSPASTRSSAGTSIRLRAWTSKSIKFRSTWTRKHVAFEFAGGRDAEFDGGRRTSVEPSNIDNGGYSRPVVSVNFAFADFAARPSAIASADCRKTISDRLDLLCRMYF
ncbi:hypothetical protein VPH35_081991 [Triticum aestivum]|uniref:Uncharacterized protein n=1 Tax=Triticum aestivum TaxID=4565 RepID=A0A3B6KF34_WHEAT